MEIFKSILPALQHLGILSYWLVLLFSFGESLALVGEFIPGGLVVMFAGFLSAQGYLDFGDLILFSAIGAILGDGLSYWLGTKGTHFFRNENKWLKLSHLKKGERFFKQHGNKSVLLGRFFSPIRPIVPFVAGLFKMRPGAFFFWNIISGIAWAIVFLSFGYFFGGTLGALETWTTHAGLIAFILIVVIGVAWYLVKRKRESAKK